MAERDQTGGWTNYVYANGQKIAHLTSVDAPIHLSGTNCSDCGTQATRITLTAGSGYTIRDGDSLSFFQYNAEGSYGGLILNFTDGSRAGGFNPLDQNGQQLNCDGTPGEHVRRLDLSQFAGKILDSTYVINDICSPPGRFDQYFNDIAIRSSNGDVISLYSPQPGTSHAVTSMAGVTDARAVSEGNTFATASETAAQATHYYLADHLGTTQIELSAGGWPT